jgi:hypothetical protein
MVANQGNIRQAFTLTWQSLNDELAFEPDSKQELRIPPGEAAAAEFRASPRRRPIVGTAATLPFTTRVQSVSREGQNLRGEVISRALIPGWVLALLLVLILALSCGSGFVLLGGTVPWPGPTAPAIAPPMPEIGTPMPTEVLPTDLPPEVATGEPPVEPSAEAPVEPTPEQPVAPTEETGGETGQLLPWLPPFMMVLGVDTGSQPGWHADAWHPGDPYLAGPELREMTNPCSHL